MGLRCSHDAFYGAYSAFNRLRQAVCHAADGSYPPHWKYTETGELIKEGSGLARKEGLDEANWYIGDDYLPDENPGLFEFLRHSDCDGEISPEMCEKVANELEALLPKLEAMNWTAYGHIAEVLKRFIAGCRAAAAANEPLEFC